MHRSRAMTIGRQEVYGKEAVDVKNGRCRRPVNHRSLSPPYWPTHPLPQGTRYSVGEPRSADDLDSYVSCQPGYLESMFRKEREVYRYMQKDQSDTSDDETIRNDPKKDRKSAKYYVSDMRYPSNPELDGCDRDISLPVVRRKSEPAQLSDSRTRSDSNEGNSGHENKPEESAELLTKNNGTEERSVTSLIEEDERVSSGQMNGEQKTDSADNRRKISPVLPFLFDISPEKSEEVTRRAGKDKRRQLYKQGGRRYTVQGLTHHHDNDEFLADLRPQYPRELSIIPEDLVSVYRKMAKEDLIKLVITHKAQLIRKDQYVKDMEDYIDTMLVRVMESNPRLLQTKPRYK